MGALEKIVDQINLSTQKEIEKLNKENEKECAKIIDQAKLEINQVNKEMKQRIYKFKNDLELKLEAENEVYRNKAILGVKRKLIIEAIQSAVRMLCCSKKYEDRYFEYMERKIDQSLPKEDCIIFYGKFDFERFTKNLKFKEDGHIKIKQAIDFDYGSKIVCVDFEVNLNVETLFFDKIDEFELDILKILIS